MRLARFAVAGLVLGITAGFVAALLRPRPRTRLDPAPSQSLVEATGQPIAWGTRSSSGTAPSAIGVSRAGSATQRGTGSR